MKTHSKVAILIAVATSVRLLMAARLNLGDDEALYWTWTKLPAACYYDHPGMLAWLITATTRLLGDTSLAVRLPTILLGAVSTWMISFLGRRLFGEKVGWWCALAFTLTPLYALGSFLVASDAPLGVFWLLAVAAMAEAVVFGRRWMLYAAGLALGLALVSKYTAVLLIPSALLFLATSRESRREFARKDIYLAAIVAFVVFLPVFLWNASHNWESFRFNLQGRHGAGTLTTKWFLQLLEAELLAVSPLLLGSLLFGFLRLKALRNSGARYRLLFWFSAPTLLLFWGASTFARILPHWPAPGYLALIAGTAALWSGAAGRKAQRWWPASVLAVAGLITLLLHIQPFYRLLPLPPGDDNTNHLYGWRQVADVVRKEQTALKNEGRTAFLLADRYQFAAQLAWNLKQPSRAVSLNPEKDQFDFWMDKDKLIGSDGILVWEDDWGVRQEVLRAFRSTREVARIAVYRQGRRVRLFHVVRCEGLERLP